MRISQKDFSESDIHGASDIDGFEEAFARFMEEEDTWGSDPLDNLI